MRRKKWNDYVLVIITIGNYILDLHLHGLCFLHASCGVQWVKLYNYVNLKLRLATIIFIECKHCLLCKDRRPGMEQRAGAGVDYYCQPIVIKPTSFYEHYRRPLANDQRIIGRESYPQQQVPAAAHHQRHGSPYNHHTSYHHHHHRHQYGRGTDVTGYDDVMESPPRSVTSFTELQPTRRALVSGRSVSGQSLVGSTDWTATPPTFSAHSQHHCKYFLVMSLWLSCVVSRWCLILWRREVTPHCFVQTLTVPRLADFNRKKNKKQHKLISRNFIHLSADNYTLPNTKVLYYCLFANRLNDEDDYLWFVMLVWGKQTTFKHCSVRELTYLNSL